jgi:signal transduction histidine kinase
MLGNLINIQYCYEYLVNQIPMGLLLYSHLPAALIALLFSLYVFIKSKNLSSLLLFTTCLVFAAWSALDLSAWFAFLGSNNTMFAWSLLDFIAVLMFFLGYYFIYVFITKRDLPLWQKVVGFILILPSSYVAFRGLNLSAYDLNTCEALENGIYTKYTYYSEAIFFLYTLCFVIFRFRISKDGIEKRRIFLSGMGILLFMGVFFSAGLLVWLLAETNAALYAYNYLIYALFGMPLLLAFLGYIIVKYRAFDIRIFGAQALIITLVALVGSQFFFIQNDSTRVLTGITLIILGLVGINLMRSVKREISQREHIEILAKDLSIANDKLKELDQMKSEFLSLATHQIRSPLTSIKGYASLLMEGDYGVIDAKAREGISVIYNSTDNLVKIVGDFLNISRLEQGRMIYNKDVFDLVKAVKETVDDYKPNIDKANLTVKLEVPPGELLVNADRVKIKEIVGNLIDNATK